VDLADLADGRTADLTPPMLHSPRLLLRPHRAADLDACAAMWAHPEVTKHIGGRVLSRNETWKGILQYAGLWTVLGYGYWAIEEISSGDFVGDVGFADFYREIEPSIAGIPEAGWALHPRFFGRGYATEALRAALQWGDENLNSDRTVCIIAPENAASIRVAEKNGYRQILQTTYKDEATLLFDRTRA
jgi:RimJ/RimL family protein N-acetyltransferase